MFIIRYPYSHQYRRVIVIVYWSEYPDDVIRFLNDTLFEQVNGNVTVAVNSSNVVAGKFILKNVLYPTTWTSIFIRLAEWHFLYSIEHNNKIRVARL